QVGDGKGCGACGAAVRTADRRCARRRQLGCGALAARQGAQRDMQFTKRLREPIMRGEITCSVRIWRSAHVKPGGRYALGSGFVVVKSIRRIALADITPALARRSGFAGVVDLLKIAKHGPGEKVYLVDFLYVDKRKPADGKVVRPRVRRRARRL